MPSLITEHQVWLDTAGQPIVNGSIYIGTQNTDPVANPISIYSDRALSVSIANPQSTDSYGRATNKIWVPAKYSIRVDDSAGVQQYQELDAGDPETTGITTLTNVLGTDTITADGSPTIATLTDSQQYNFRAANTNTGPVTLQIDLTAAKTIKKLHDIDLIAGDIEQNQTVSVIYNATDDVFELVSQVSTGDFVDVNVSNDLDVGNILSISGTNIFSLVYPVGSVYISTVNTNPNTLFGIGTWAATGEGRVLVGVGTSDAAYALDGTGGASTHVLTEAEMPSHTHGHTIYDSGGSDTPRARGTSGSAGQGTVTGNSTGGDTAHENMPPYLVVHMWERTA